MFTQTPDRSQKPYVVGILPARWGSSRFPGKPLYLLAGKPMIQRVWERCQTCQLLDQVIIATDDQRIIDCAQSFGALAVMTSPDHPSGSDRIAEAIQSLPQAEIVINIQGDEPLISPALIDELALALIENPSLDMATAANVLEDLSLLSDPNVVKVAMSQSGRALYFSRSPIPFNRSAPASLQYFRHKGIYAYRRAFLEHFVRLPQSPLEQCEQLEQLRALEHDASIQVLITEDDSIGVDTPEQAQLVESLLHTSIH